MISYIKGLGVVGINFFSHGTLSMNFSVLQYHFALTGMEKAASCIVVDSRIGISEI